MENKDHSKNLCILLVYLHIAIRCTVHTTSNWSYFFIFVQYYTKSCVLLVFLSLYSSSEEPYCNERLLCMSYLLFFFSFSFLFDSALKRESHSCIYTSRNVVGYTTYIRTLGFRMVQRLSLPSFSEPTAKRCLVERKEFFFYNFNGLY